MSWPSFLKSKKWLILGLLAVLFPLFQNMSPSGSGDLPTHENEDLRLWAPQKPKGYFDDAFAAYVPMDFHGHSLNDVGQSLLDHNFGDQVHQWEDSLQHWGPDHYMHDDLFGVSTDLSEDNGGEFRWGLPQPTMMRFSYLSEGGITDGYKLTCDVGPGVSGARFAFSKKLDAHLNLEMTHQTSDRQSQIHMTWDW
jgi:hypothetical protein